MKYFLRRSTPLILFLLVSTICCLVVEAGVCGPEKRFPKNLTPTDWIRAENGELTIQGTVLLSFEDDHIFMQSGSSFLEIRRDLIRVPDPAKLNQPGTRVILRIPQQAIRRAWAVNFGDSEKNEVARAACLR